MATKIKTIGPVKRCEGPCGPAYNPCGAGVGCSYECKSNYVSGCPDAPLGEDGPPAACLTVNTFVPCLDADPATVVISAKVRLTISGLTVGQDYVATIHFKSSIDNLSSVDIEFTATSETEVSDWVSLPAAILDVESWAVDSCSVA